MFASVTSTPHDFATYCDVNKPLTPDNIVFVAGGRRIGNQLHVLEESDLGLVEECSHYGMRWSEMVNDGSR
jgi:hypothetical protein